MKNVQNYVSVEEQKDKTAISWRQEGRVLLQNEKSIHALPLTFPVTLNKDGSLVEVEGQCLAPGTLPKSVEISHSAEDMLKKLLQPDPRVRLKSLFALQRIAFFMGNNIRSYSTKKISPFRLLGQRSWQRSQQTKIHCDPFKNFDSFVGGSTNRKW